MPVFLREVSSAGPGAVPRSRNVSVLREPQGLKSPLFDRLGKVVGPHCVVGGKHVDSEVHEASI